MFKKLLISFLLTTAIAYASGSESVDTSDKDEANE